MHAPSELAKSGEYQTQSEEAKREPRLYRITDHTEIGL